MRNLNHIMPFLWVHGEDEETYRKMIGVINDANLHAFCVEARPHKNFCHDQWWHDMDIILDEAEKREMQVWILDDKHFPTGFANGHALNAPLEQRRQGLLHKVFRVKHGKIRLNLKKQCHPSGSYMGTERIMYPITNMFNQNNSVGCKFTDDRLLGVAAVRLDKAEEPLDLNSYIKNDKLEWEAPKGEWSVQICYLSRNIGTHRSYINMMDKKSCRIQLDAVYEPHYAHYKDKFGKVIAGFFSDEPELGNNYMYRMENPLGTNQDLPWSCELESMLCKRLGKDYTKLLMLLWDNNCDSKLTAKVRYIYMDCVTRLVEESFSHQIGTWCREHGVEYIGHVVEDNNQHARTGTSLGHYFRGLKWQSMAGIDDIGGQVEPGCEDRHKKSVFGYTGDGEFYHYALGKLASSMAALNPNMRDRAMCEIFGNYGWCEGIRLEKYLVDHFMVRGVNYFVPHAFTCSPYPEKDCPPHFYAQGNNPQYRHFGALMAYTDRVCRLISEGKIVTPVAILYHAEAEWSGKAMLMQKPARILTDNQIDFNFVPADVFVEREFYKTEIKNKLTINGKEHQVLLIPYAEFITKETAEAIETLSVNGGKVFFIDSLPEGLCTGEQLPEAVKNCPVVALSDLLTVLEPLELNTVKLLPADNRIRVMHYVKDKEFYYLFNEGDKTYHGKTILPTKSEVYSYNAWLDSNERLDVKGSEVVVELAPSQSLFIMCGKPEKVEESVRMQGNKLSLTQFEQSVCRAIEYPQFVGHRVIDSLQDYALTNKKFSGYIRYETSFEAKEGKFGGLEIEDAYEGVEVFVNGKSLGIQIIPPFQFNLTPAIKTGKNHLVIEVATTLERERGNTKNAAPIGITGEVNLHLK